MLLTQLPLPDTVVDLWRLVESFDVTTIVSLGSLEEEKKKVEFSSVVVVVAAVLFFFVLFCFCLFVVCLFVVVVVVVVFMCVGGEGRACVRACVRA